MAVVRVHKSKNYTVMSNYHLRETRMSLKAKGLMSVMLSLPEEWDYSISGLVKICKEGRDSVTAALNELKDFGYLSVSKSQGDDGKFIYTYNIYEFPINIDNIQKPATEKPLTVKPVMEKPLTENPEQLNTNNQLLNNKVLNNKDIGQAVPDRLSNDIAEVVDYLNEKAGTHYKSSTPKTRQLIKARSAEGFSVNNFKTVIDKKCAEWLGDAKMAKYIRPETLFGTKFESYLNQADVSTTSFTGFSGSFENEEEW